MTDTSIPVLDVITISEIYARGRHGVTEAERSQNLPLEVSVELHLDLRKAASTDDLEHTVNYATLYEKIVNVVETKSRNLLEQLAQDLLDAIFEDKKVVQASVRIFKPKRLNGATPSVKLTRRNSV